MNMLNPDGLQGLGIDPHTMNKSSVGRVDAIGNAGARRDGACNVSTVAMVISKMTRGRRIPLRFSPPLRFGDLRASGTSVQRLYPNKIGHFH